MVLGQQLVVVGEPNIAEIYKMGIGLHRYLFFDRQHVQLCRGGQKAAVPHGIGIHPGFGRKGVGHLGSHQRQAWGVDLTKAFGACAAAVDGRVDGQLQAAGFERHVDDAVAGFHRLNGLGGLGDGRNRDAVAAKLEGKTGSPEKPLSDLGKLSYRSYWTYVLMNLLKNYDTTTNTDISIGSMSRETGIKTDDLISTLQSLDMLKVWKGQHVVFVEQAKIREYMDQKYVASPFFLSFE